MKFDPDKEYGCQCLVTDVSKIEDARNEMRRHYRFVVPTEMQKNVEIIVSYSPERTITAREDNLEQLGATKKEIGMALVMGECWMVGWIYKPTKETVNV